MKTVLVCFFDNVIKSRLTSLISGSYAALAGEKFIENPRFSAFFFIFATADQTFN